MAARNEKSDNPYLARGEGRREIPRPPFGTLDTGNPIRVLSIEDNPIDFEIAVRALRGAPVEIEQAETLEDGVDALRHRPFHLILLDLQLPDATGLQALLALTAEAPQHPIIVMTGRDDEETGIVALKAGAQDYFPKSSLDKGQLLRSIRYAIARKRQEEKLIHLNSVLQSIRAIHKEMKSAKGSGDLARSVCRSIVRYRGYAGAWMFLVDRDGQVLFYTSAGGGPAFDIEHPDPQVLSVVRGAMAGKEVFRTSGDMGAVWNGAERMNSGDTCLWLRLASATRCHGVMGVRISESEEPTLEEVELLAETAEDIAYALQGIEARDGRAEAEAALHRSEARYALLFNKVHDAILVHDVEPDGRYGRIVDANEIACQRYGYTRGELLQMDPSQLSAPGSRPAPEVWERLQRDGQVLFELDQQTRDGRVLPVEVSAQLMELDGCPAILSIIRDISDRRRAEREKEDLEQQLLRASRMEAIGKLAGGVAHDFNNLLSAIFGWSEMASELLPPGHTAGEMLEEIQKAGKKAATVTRQLLAMSRRQLMRIERLDLNRVVVDMEKMLRRLIGEDVELVVDLAPGLPLIRADVGQLEQVLLNLAVNARDAMPSGGRLRLSTAAVQLSRAEVRRLADLSPGPHVLLEVSDSGCGMDRETVTRAFEPFFTTKQSEDGTGLGLSTVYGIVKQLGGDITIESRPGHGATFRAYFPVAGEGDDHSSGAGDKWRGDVATGNETILLVEDDRSVREVARRILEQCGYTVLQAEGFDDAVVMHRKHSGQIQLLLTDVILRGWSGKDLVDTLVATDPGLKVLFMSGYADDKLARHGVLAADQALIHKPFTLQRLAKKVREVLDKA